MNVQGYLRQLRRRMRNPYPHGSIAGVDNPGIAPLALTVAATVTLTAGSEVTIGTFAQLVGVPGMNYIPVIMGVCNVLQGSTPSAALVFGALFTGGSDFATQAAYSGSLIASQGQALSVLLVGANVRAAANGNIGSTTIAFTGKTTTTACTVEGPSTAVFLFAFPGPDL
jgi:hypothetical protein